MCCWFMLALNVLWDVEPYDPVLNTSEEAGKISLGWLRYVKMSTGIEKFYSFGKNIGHEKVILIALGCFALVSCEKKHRNIA